MATERGGGTIAESLRTLGAAAVTAPVEAPVVSLTDQALSYLNDPYSLEQGAAAERNNNLQSELMDDMRSMDYGSVVQKYGLEVANRRHNILSDDGKFNSNFETDRGIVDETLDFGLGVGAGFVGMVGGIESVAGSLLFEEEVGTRLAETTNKVTEGIRSLQSDELQDRRRASRVMQQLDSQENQQAYENDIAQGNSAFMSGLRSIGRGVANSAETYWNDGALSLDVISEGLGSFGPSTKIAQGAARLAQPLLRSQAARAAQVAAAAYPTRLNVARAALYRNAETIAIAGSVGVTEASGVYPQAVAVVMDMSDQELMESSDDYRRLREGGMDVDSAKRSIANDAGLLAAAVQLPVAMLAGLGVSKFEVNPLRRQGFIPALRDIGTQTIEEGFQSATGEISSNLGIQTFADENRSISEGVGESLVQGAVGGMGMAGILQAPNIAGATARSTVGAVTTAAKDYVAGQNLRRDNASPVGDRATLEAAVRVEQNLTTLGPDFGNVVVMSDDEIAGMSDTVRAIALPDGAPNSRLGVIDRLVQAVKSKSLDKPASREAVLQAYMEMQKLQGFALNDIPQEIQSLSEDDPIRVAYEQAQADLGAIVENPSYKSVMEIAQSMEQDNTPDIAIPELTPAFINETIAIAMSNPAGVNPRFIDAILNQEGTEESDPTDPSDPANPSSVIDFSRRIKPLVLTESVRSRLTAAKVISEEMLKSIEIKNQIEEERVESINSSPTTETKISPRKTKDIVRQEIHIDGMNIGKGKKSGGMDRILPSLNDFYRNIVASVENNNQPVLDRQGLPVDSQSSVESLGNFARHMAYKIGAFNKSAQGGKGEQVPFRTLTTNGWVNPDKSGASKVYANTKSPNSIALSKEALVDAQTAVSLYNNMLTLFPHLKGSPLELPVLVSELADAGKIKIAQDEVKKLANQSEAPVVTDGDPNDTVTTKEVVEPTKEKIVDPEDQGEIKPKEKTKEEVVEQIKPKSQEEIDDDLFRETQAIYELDYLNIVEKESLGLYPDSRFSVPTREQHKILVQVLTDYLQAFGMAFGREVVGGFIVKNGGYAKWDQNLVGLDAQVLVNPETDRSRHIIHHEVGHILDNKLGENNQRRSVIDGRLSPEKEGDLFKEIMELVKRDEKWNKFFEYALSGGVNSQTAESLDNEKSQELFAELFSIYNNNPTVMGEVLPNAKEYIRAIVDEAIEGDTGSNDGETTPTESIPSEDGTETNTKEVVVADDIPLSDKLAKDSKGVSRFTRAYVIQKGRSLLSSLVQPLLYMVETFGSAALMNERSKNELMFSITSTQREAFQTMLREDIPAIMGKMNARLKNVIFDNKSNKSIIDLIQGDQTDLDATSLLKGKVGTLVNIETGQYDERLLEQAVMAGIHWVMNARNSPDRVYTLEKAAKIFKVDEGDITQEMLDALRFGIDQTSAKEQLSSLIEQFWGVSRKNDVTMSDTRGISESLAAELLTVLEGDYVKTGEFMVNRYVYNEDTDTIKTTRIKMFTITTNVESFQNRVKSFGQLSHILADMIIEGHEREGGIIGKPPTSVVVSQRRNPFSAISRKETIAVQTAQKIEFYRNTDFIDMMNAMGQEAYSKILGFVEIDETTTNKQNRKSIEGKNVSIRMGWDGVMAHDVALKSYADANGMNIDDVPTFYNWYITKVGRLHMNGFGPQSDKTSREATIATVANLNMKEEEDQGFFWMTVAQSLGMKVEKSNRYANMKEAKKLVKSKYPQSIKALEAWLKDTSKPLGSTEVQTIQSELKESGEETQKAMHALLAVAKLNRAKRKRDPEAMTNFKHMLSLEADGKTDGPINAMMHFISGKFTQRELDLLAKGGFFLNKKSYAFSDHVNDGDTDDLYMVAAKKMQRQIRELRDFFIREKSPSLKYMDALLRLSNHFGEIEFNEKTGELVIGRNTMKNPLTVTIYGSGVDGITRKVANALMNSIYENFTREAQQANDIISYKEMNADMNLLFGTKTFRNNNTGEWNVYSKQKVLSYSSDPVNFEFTKEARENFHTNLKDLFIKPMSIAIDEMMGSTVTTMRLFQQASQIQSIVMIDYFNSRMKEKTEELVKSGELKVGEFLSQKDYNAIFKEMSRFGAIVENDDQTVNMGNAAKGEGTRAISSNLDGEFRGNANLSGPSEAGVKSAPYITINRGDALMIINIYGESITVNKSLAVFDGVEIAADEIDTASEIINEAVAKSWETNPAKDVSDGFNAFLREKPLDGISPEGVLKLYEGLRLDKDVNLEDVMKLVRDNLEEIANEIQARKDTIKEIAYSVDHMAGAGSPFTHEGVILTGSKEDVIKQINDIYEAKLKKNNAQKPKRALEKENARFRNLVRKFGTQNETDDVVTMYWKEFSKMMENNTGLSADQKRIYEVIKNAVDKDFTFIFGSQEEVTKYRDRVHAERSNGKSIPEGQIDTLNKIIYVTNISNETTLHELVHAATIGKVFDYYVNPSTLTPKEQDAVRRMEVLMNEFRTRDYGYDTAQIREATRLAKKAIEENLSLSTDLGMASALNEFMAWSMTNQNIVNVSKVTRIKNPLALIAQKVLKLMGRLVGGDIFSNMLFNTEVLLSRPQELNEVISAVVQLNQQGGSQVPTKMSLLMDRFENKVAHWVRNREMSDPLATARYDHVLAESQAKQTVNLFDANGFRMDMEQTAAFKSIQAAMATTMKVDGLVQARMQKVYTYTMKQLSVESFMVDPQSTNPNDRWLAEHQYNVLSGAYGTVTDVQGNSNLLSSFVALSQTNEDFRSILEKISIPKAFSIDKSSVDAFLTSSANSMMDSLAITITKEGKDNQSIRSAMDNLTHALSSVERDAQSYIEKSYNGLINKADSKGQEILTRIGDEIFDRSDVQIRNTSSNLKKSIFYSTKLLSGILSENKGEIIANAGISFMNEMGDTLMVVREFMAEIIGITNENKGVLMQVNLVKKAVSSVRQDYRETLPRIFESKFSRDLTKEEKSMLHLSMGKTDISALGQSLTVEEISELLKENINVINAVVAAEKELSVMSKAHAADYMRKAKQLGNYMINGIAGENLLRNATAISRLLNEDVGPVVADKDTVKLIDKLATLYAIQNLDRDTKDKMSKLAKEESAGLEFMIHYLYALRTKEEEKISNFGTEVALLNGFKGYIPAEVQDGVQLILRSDSENTNLVKMGYTRVGEYKGPGFRVGPVKMGYYYSAVSGKATYSQGAMQTVQTAINGVDPRNGRTLTGDTAGFMSGTSVSLINKKAKTQTKNNATETLMPVFNEVGNVVAFERSMNPDVMRTLNRNTNMGEAMGMWRGRQAEEEISKQYNQVLVDRIKEMWDTAKVEGRTKGYVDISESDDPIHMENWMMVPKEMKDYIETVFGDEGFMVRADVVNNVLGYRTPSIADAWTGNTRMSEGTRKVITELASIIPNDKGYKYALLGERGVQVVVSTAKDIIIIRSIVVPVSNIISNQLQLMMRGVPVRNMLKTQRQALIEINTYLYHEQRRVELEAEIQANQNNPQAKRKAETELKSMSDFEQKMGIWPLIKAGEFSTISEGMTDIDEALKNQKLYDWLEVQVGKLPHEIKTLGKYAIVARDTALYQGMYRAVQYGDFLAKATYYDHLVNETGLTHEEALVMVTEEFVNYNLLPGRTRSYLESMGLLWFWNFKLRSMKVALRIARQNPVRMFLLGLSGPVMPDLGAGSPITDNLLSVWEDGRLPHSVGPSMALQAPSLIPLTNLMF